MLQDIDNNYNDDDFESTCYVDDFKKIKMKVVLLLLQLTVTATVSVVSTLLLLLLHFKKN